MDATTSTVTSTRSPAVWSRRSRWATARRSWLLAPLVPILVGAVGMPLAMMGRHQIWWDEVSTGEVGAAAATLVDVTSAALVLAFLAMPFALWFAGAALQNAPRDDMDTYGAGRRVDLAWRDRWSAHGTVTVEDRPGATTTRQGQDGLGRRCLPAVVTPRGGGSIRVLGSSFVNGAASDYRVLQGTEGRGSKPGRVAHGRVQVDSHAGPKGLLDWTLVDEHGTTLRWRQWPGRVARLTLVDASGTAWWIARRSRTAWRAELPDELSEAAAPALLLVVEHQLVDRPQAAQYVKPSYSG